MDAWQKNTRQNADKSLTVNGVINFDQAEELSPTGTKHYSAFMPPS